MDTSYEYKLVELDNPINKYKFKDLSTKVFKENIKIQDTSLIENQYIKTIPKEYINSKFTIALKKINDKNNHYDKTFYLFNNSISKNEKSKKFEAYTSQGYDMKNIMIIGQDKKYHAVMLKKNITEYSSFEELSNEIESKKIKIMDTRFLDTNDIKNLLKETVQTKKTKPEGKNKEILLRTKNLVLFIFYMKNNSEVGLNKLFSMETTPLEMASEVLSGDKEGEESALKREFEDKYNIDHITLVVKDNNKDIAKTFKLQKSLFDYRNVSDILASLGDLNILKFEKEEEILSYTIPKLEEVDITKIEGNTTKKEDSGDRYSKACKGITVASITFILGASIVSALLYYIKTVNKKEKDFDGGRKIDN